VTRRARGDDEGGEAQRERRKPRSKDKRGGSLRGSKRNADMKPTGDTIDAEIEDIKIDDSKPWEMNRGGMKPEDDGPRRRQPRGRRRPAGKRDRT
jgi:hypothetical protein